MLVLLDPSCQGSNHHRHQYQNMTTLSPNESLHRMMSDCHMDTVEYDDKCYHLDTNVSAVRRNFDKIESEPNQVMLKKNVGKMESDSNQMILDKMKAESWKNHDSMHTTTRTGKCMNDEYRRWNSLDSVHTIKAETLRTSMNGMEGRSAMLMLSTENDMQGSNSDYNDSLCSFASFGEASFSDNMDVSANRSLSGNGRVDSYPSKKSIHISSMEFTKSFDNEENPLYSFKQPTPLMKSSSYRGCGNNSLSQIRETVFD